MRNIKFLIAILALVLVFGGCSKLGKGSKSGADGDGKDLSEVDLDAQREGRYGGGSIPSAEGEGVFRDIRFDYDSAAINDLARQGIEYNLEVLKVNPDVSVQLEGHCDERGTTDYNLALGSQRARAVLEVLQSYGIPSSRLKTISYGEEMPLDPGHSEAAWARNRRVHFSAYRNLPR